MILVRCTKASKCRLGFVKSKTPADGHFSREHPIRRDSHLSPQQHKNTAHQNGVLYFWLGRSDSNTRMTESESVALPLGDAPICGKSFPFTCVILSKIPAFGKRFRALLESFFKKAFLWLYTRGNCVLLLTVSLFCVIISKMRKGEVLCVN